MGKMRVRVMPKIFPSVWNQSVLAPTGHNSPSQDWMKKNWVNSRSWGTNTNLNVIFRTLFSLTVYLCLLIYKTSHSYLLIYTKNKFCLQNNQGMRVHYSLLQIKLQRQNRLHLLDTHWMYSPVLIIVELQKKKNRCHLWLQWTCSSWTKRVR